MTGTATNSSIYFTNVKKIMAKDIKEGNYTISFKNGSNTSFIAYRLRKYDGTTKTEIKAPTTLAVANYTFTINLKNLIDENTKQVELDIVRYGTGENDQTLYPQIEVGNTATDYEPHYEQEYELDLPVENLFDGLIETGNISSGENIADSNIRRSTNYIAVLSSKNYTFSIDGAPHRVVVSMYDENKSFITTSGQTGLATTTGTFTTYSNAKFIRIRCYNGDASLFEGGKLQIEPGDTANPYTPYGTTPIELAEANDIRDEIYEANDKWYVKKRTGKKTLVGTEIWTDNNTWDDSTGNNIIHCHTTAFTGIWLVGQTKYYSDQFIGTYEGNRNWGLEEMTCHTTNASLYIFVKRERLDGITPQSTNNEKQEALKRWLAVNKPTVWFALATPTDTEITYEPLIEQLNAIKDARLYDGMTNIITEGNLPGIFSGKTYTTESTELTIENEGNIYARPKLTLTGIADISIYLNGSQIFILNLDREAPETIIIDCENMDAFYDGVLKNRKVTGDYSNFKLQPGNNQIAVSGTVAELKVETYSRWL